MDKTARLKYALGLPSGEISPDDAPLMAVVVGMMHAVTCELAKSADLPPAEDTERLAQMVQQLPCPSPELSPEQVMKIQLSALKLNDLPVPDHGLGLAFAFCTPDSRAYLGCITQMKALFADPTYAPLLGFAAVEFQPMHCKAGRARQRFTVTTPAGQRASYVAHLIRTASGPERGCWLTEAILRIAGS